MGKDKIVIYFGFNNPLIYKRGVENVILSQSMALPENVKKYIYFLVKKMRNFCGMI